MQKTCDQRLRELREDHDLLQKEVAAALEIRCNVYQRYEYGIRMIPTEKLILAADFYNTSTDYILGRTNNPEPYDKA